MGLVNLKTNLKSLRYGNDRPGGGSSGQPYITTPIPDGLTAVGPDFLLRQGALRASLTDSERLFKFFFDPLSPSGLLFTAKQELLERQNPVIPGGLNRIYLPTSTISQAGLNTLGFHLNKQGLDPFEPGYAQGGTEGYFNYTLNKDTLENVSRLSLLYSSKIAKSPPSSLRAAQEREFNISNNPDFSLSYSGGPNAIGGLGNTNIKLAGGGTNNNPNVPRDRTNTYKLVSNLTENFNQVYAFNNDLLVNQTSAGKTKVINITDYRKTINDSLDEKILPATDYARFNRETTYGTTVSTVYNIAYPRTTDGNVDPNQSAYSDLLNITPSTTLTEAQNPDNDYFNKDLIKFFFEVINPTAVDAPSDYLFFRAYLNGIGDNFKGEWQPYKYVGRAENFYKYAGFSRDVSLSFTIYAHSRAEMLPLYQKLNKLLGATAPTYGGNGYMLGNLIKLTAGTYFNSVPGIVNSINLKPSFEAGWDINRDIDGMPIKEETDTYVGQIPKMIEVDMTFTPIHDFTPQYPIAGKDNGNNVNFINNKPVSKPPKTESPSSTNEGTNTPAPNAVDFTNPITRDLNRNLNPGLGSGVLLPGN
jgi:hypothetical protein